MNETDKKEQEQEELIRQYVKELKGWSYCPLRDALIYFLTKDRTALTKDQNTRENFSVVIEENNLIAKRKLFILKVLKECTHAGAFQLALVPDEVENKLVAAYTEEKQKEEQKEINAKKARIAELVEEMNEIF